jgi:hypothetical protein
VPVPDHPELRIGTLRCARRPLGTAETSLVFGYVSEIAAGEEGVASQPTTTWNRLLAWVAAVEEIRQSVQPSP